MLFKKRQKNKEKKVAKTKSSFSFSKRFFISSFLLLFAVAGISFATYFPSGTGGLWNISGNNLFWNSGNVGIGTNFPQAKLDIQGVTGTGTGVSFFSDTTSAGNQPKLRIYGYADNYSTQKYADLYIDTYGRFRITGTNAYFSGIAADSFNTGSNQRNSISNGSHSSLFMGLGEYNAAGDGRNMIIGVKGSSSQVVPAYTTTPTLYIASSDTTTGNSKYLKFYHDQTNGNIETGVGNLILTPASNVGIGTTSPTQKLQVAGYVRGDTGLCIGSDCRTSWPNSSLWTDAGSYIYANNSTSTVITDTGNVGIGTTSPGAKLHVTGGSILNNDNLNVNGDNFIVDTVNKSTSLYAYGVRRSGVTVSGLTIGGGGYFSGNVGIGTTSPAYPLDVAGTINATGELRGITKLSFDRGTNYTIYTNSNGLIFDGGDGTADFLVYDGASYTGQLKMGYNNSAIISTYDTNESLTIRANGSGNIVLMDTGTGNVGVGTTSPTEKLTIDDGNIALENIGADLNSVQNGLKITTVDLAGSTGNAGVYLSAPYGGGTANNGFIRVKRGQSNVYNGMEISSSGDFRILTNSTSEDSNERLRITSSGNVGIGTTSPSQKLQVAGYVRGDTGLCIGADCRIAWPDGADNLGDHTATQNLNLATYQLVGNGGSSGISIASNGNVGIGTSSPAGKLDVAGDIVLASSGGNKQIYTWSGTDSNWRIGMSTTPGFTRSLATSHVQYLTYAGGSTQGFAVGVNGGDSSFEIRGSDHTAFFRGNVGLGTANPYHLLDLGSSTGKKFAVYQNSSGTDFYGLGISSGTLEFYAADSGSENPGMVLKSSGNVGIGTTSPSQRLDVTGYVRGSTGLCIGADCRTSWPNSSLWTDAGSYINASNATNVVVTDTGRFGVGTTSPSTNLHVVGTGRFTSGLQVGSQYISDRIYNPSNGILIATDIAVSDNRMIELYIEGNSYSSLGPIDAIVQAYNYTGNGQIIATSAITKGPLSNVDVFHYNGYVYFWLPQTSNYQTYRFRLATHSGAHRITSITNAAKPTSGVTNSVTIVPMKSWYSANDGSGSGLDADLWDGNQFATYLNQPLLTSSSPSFSALTLSGTLSANNGISVDGNTVIDNGAGWHRSYGNTGWYNGTYGGGWYMTDSTWIRSYGSKSIYHNSGILRTDGTFQVGGGGSTLNVVNGGDFAYRTNVLFANTAGNVGIGTTTPSQKLQVAGYVRGDTGLCIGADCRTDWPAGVSAIDNLSDAQKDTTNNNFFLGHNGFSGTFYNEYNTGIGIGSFNNPNVDNTYAFLGDRNTAVGYYSLSNNTTGYQNSAVGAESMFSNTTGKNNAAFGNTSLYSNTSGSNNAAFGDGSLYSNTDGIANTAQGNATMYYNTTGDHNTALGYLSLYHNTTGDSNVALGSNAGTYIADGSTANTVANQSVFLGGNTKAQADNQTNQIVIGYNATGLGSNTVVLGNDSIVTTALKGNVGIGTTSPSAKLDVSGTGKFSAALTLTGQTDDADGNNRSSYWSYDPNVALVMKPAANDGATAILFPSIGNSPSDFAYIVYDEDYGEAGKPAGENGALILGAENDGAGSSDHVRVKSRLVVEADMSSSDPTEAFQVKSGNVSSDLFTVLRSGNVGVGTTSPTQKLQVAGYVRGDTGLCIGADCRIAWPNGADNLGNHTATQNLNLATYQLVGNGGSSGISIASNGNVGIGATSPAVKLQVGTDAGVDNDMRIYSDTAGAYFSFLSRGNYGGIEHYGGKNLMISSEGAGGYMTFFTSGTQNMIITDTGNVGIGTGNPQGKLHISGGDLVLDETLGTGGGNDSYTKLLLHMDGSNGSVAFDDSSASAHSPVAYNGAQIYWGGKFSESGYFDGTDAHIRIPSSPDFALAASDDWTVDFWFNKADTSGVEEIFSKSGGNFRLRFQGGDVIMRLNGCSTDPTFTLNYNANTWYHLAVSKSGNNLRLFLNGTQIGSTYNASCFTGTSEAELVLGVAYWDYTSNDYHGYLDEFRFSKGIARWTSNFTPPASPYAGQVSNSGAIGIGVTNPTYPIQHSSGAHLTGGGVWVNASDKNLKENFENVNSQEILEKVRKLDIKKWNYKVEKDSIKHIGPTAQDFAKIFALGGSETSISTIDPAGISLVSIKALADRVETLFEKIERIFDFVKAFYKKAQVYFDRLESLEKKVQSQEERLKKLEKENQMLLESLKKLEHLQDF